VVGMNCIRRNSQRSFVLDFTRINALIFNRMDPSKPQFPAVRVIYENPPIIERAASVKAAIPEEVFYSRLESWKAIVREVFPDYDPIQQWMLNIKQEGDVPTLDDAPAQVLVTHRFWKRNAENRRFMSMRLLPTRLTLNLHQNKTILTILRNYPPN
jgi:hypothetical protein